MGLEPTTSGLEVQCAIQLRHASNWYCCLFSLFEDTICNHSNVWNMTAFPTYYREEEAIFQMIRELITREVN